MKINTAIIIVNWNGKHYLEECLTAVYDQTYKGFKVIVVDNGSGDGSVEYIKDSFKAVDLIELDENTGFALGNNIGIRKALKDKDIEFIVLLNNDTRVMPNWLEGLVKKVDYEKNIDMISSLALFDEETVQSAGLNFDYNFNFNKEGGLSIGYLKSPKEYKEDKEIFCPSGVSALYTRRLIESVGMFDEDFFAYAEDLDLGFRARERGYRCVFTPESRLIHYHSRTSGGAGSPFKVYLLKRNTYYFVIKNFSFPRLIVFPFLDLFFSFKTFLSGKKNKSLQNLKSSTSKFGLLKITFKVFWSVLIKSPKFFIKRFKTIKQ